MQEHVPSGAFARACKGYDAPRLMIEDYYHIRRMDCGSTLSIEMRGAVRQRNCLPRRVWM
jgi:hypothetical protein